MPEALVHKVLVPSFLEGPGSRMAVFLQGCNLACLGCHNPETLGVCDACGACLPHCRSGALEPGPTGLAHHPERCRDCGRCEAHCPSSASPRATRMTAKALEAQYQAWAPYLEGLTFSGGECSLQTEFILETAPRIQALGGTVLVDTNGLMPRKILDALAEATEGFLFDLKGLDPERHRGWTGQGNGPILENLHRSAGLGKLVEVRTVLVPGLNDDPLELEGIARLVERLPGAPSFRLTPYRHQGVRGPGLDWPEPSAERIAHSRAVVRKVLGSRLLGAPPTSGASPGN